MRNKGPSQTTYNLKEDIKSKLTYAIKSCGATLYQEADSIVGDYLWMKPGGLRIHILFDKDPGGVIPTITVEHDYIPTRKEIDLPVNQISEESP